MPYIIALIIIVIYIVYKYVKSEKIPNCSLLAVNGAPGTGKTFIAVSSAYSEYRTMLFIYYLLYPIKMITKKTHIKPTIYSNIPIDTTVTKSRKKGAIPLEEEHLTLEKRLPENCVVVIDEISTIADQNQWNDPNVCERLGKLMKFYRHWTGKGKLYITEQALSCITKPLRDKLGLCYQLTSMKRMWFLLLPLPFAKIECVPLLVIDADTATGETTIQAQERQYFMKYLPYKPLFRPAKTRYNSRCYRPVYYDGATRNTKYFQEKDLSTHYMIDITASDARIKEYSRSKKQEKDFLFDRFTLDKICDESEG